MNKAVVTIVTVMVVMAVFLFSFGVPWHANFFADFNTVKDGVIEVFEPVKSAADVLRSSYSALQSAQIFYENYEFWQGKIAKWAYICGLGNPYLMTKDECRSVFEQFDDYLTVAFDNDVSKKRQFVTECSQYVYFVVYRDRISGDVYFTWTSTTRPGQYGSIAILFNGKPDQHWLFQHIDDYSWFDMQKCFMGYYKEIGDTAVSYKTFDVIKDGETLDFYVLTPIKSIHGHDMTQVDVLDVIPFSYSAFEARCGISYPVEPYGVPTVVSRRDLRY